MAANYYKSEDENPGKNASWKSVEGGFIESSLETYARDFTAAVKENIEEMIQLVLKHQAQILIVYIESLYAGIAFSEHLDTVSTELLEELFAHFHVEQMEQDRIIFAKSF